MRKCIRCGSIDFRAIAYVPPANYPDWKITDEFKAQETSIPLSVCMACYRLGSLE